MKPLPFRPRGVIGMVHFSALEGDPAFEGMDVVYDRALQDLNALLAGGVDVVLFENNFDSPKFERLPQAQAAHFEDLIKKLTPHTPVPWGVVPLWNDYVLGFRLCKTYGGCMVRVPVFVDTVETTYGIFEGHPEKVFAARSAFQADDVLLLADVQVKHAKLVVPRPFQESLQDTINAGADAVVITGEWTGQPPTLEQCVQAQEIARSKAYVFAGSGISFDNLPTYLPHLDGCIVGSAFKEGTIDVVQKTGPNIVEASRRYDVAKIKAFMQKAKE